MEKIVKCPWDGAGKLIPGATVGQWIDYLASTGYSGNITINRTYYNFHSLRICPPSRVDLSAPITAFDDGYYGTRGVLTVTPLIG